MASFSKLTRAKMRVKARHDQERRDIDAQVDEEANTTRPAEHEFSQAGPSTLAMDDAQRKAHKIRVEKMRKLRQAELDEKYKKVRYK